MSLDDLMKELGLSKGDEAKAKQRREEGEQAWKIISEALMKYKPADIPMGELEKRLAVMAMTISPTRTTVVTMITFIAAQLPCLPVDRDDMIKLFNETYDAVAALPTTAELRAEYEGSILKKQGQIVVKGSEVVN